MKRIEPGQIAGTIEAPPSKSMTQRAVIAAALAEGQSEVLAASRCDDALASFGAARALGAVVEELEGRVLVRGRVNPPSEVIQCGESGLCLRMVSAVAALFDRPMRLEASGSLRKRPVSMIAEALTQLGARCETDQGLPPVRVQGPLRAGHISVDGSVSSQLITGLLMALPCCAEDSVVEVRELKSKPYIQMTLALLSDFGVDVRPNPTLSEFKVPGGQRYHAARYHVEGDWSGAAFPLVAGAIAGKVTVKNLALGSKQADRVVLDALKAAGAAVKAVGVSVIVERAWLRGFQADLTHCPDLFPPLAALACHCEGETVLSGATRLKHKESDRATALVKELGAIGGQLHIDGDRMVINGGPIKGGRVESHGDHRIAMAAAIAALLAEGPVDIEGEGCVSKSYPDFFERLEELRVR